MLLLCCYCVAFVAAEFLRVGLNRMGQRVLEHLPGVFSVSNRATHNVAPSMLSVAFTKTEFSIASTVQV